VWHGRDHEDELAACMLLRLAELAIPTEMIRRWAPLLDNWLSVDELGVRLTPPTRSAARLAELADLFAQGKLTVHIFRTFPLDRAADALRARKAGNIRGKIVLTIEQADRAHG
jgi:NADPH:quinone reductase-like Zn-dependent oxidoreductase